jgi:cholesterol oxidase
MGSVKLLFECKRRGFLPNLSDHVGNYIRTNSEAILGVKANNTLADYSDQIAITSGIYPDEQTQVEVVRFNKGSDAMSSLTTLLTDGGGQIPRFIRFLGNVLRHPWSFVKTLWPFGWVAHISRIQVFE